MENTKLNYYVFKITNLLSNDIHSGITTFNSTKIMVGYEKYRSQLKASLKELGEINFKKEILSSWETKENAQKEASRIRTKIYNTQKSQKLSNDEKLNILSNNLFDKKPKLSKDDKRNYQKRYVKENEDRLREYRKKYALENKEKIKKWKDDNKDDQNKKAREYYYINKESKKDEWNEKARKNRIQNRDLINEKQRVYYKKRLNNLSLTKIASGNKGDDWVFYTLKFTHKLLGFSFFKYGITFKNIHMRYRQGGYSDFDFKILDLQYGNKSFVRALEIKHLIETDDDRFEFPIKIKFGGKTECRTKLASKINIV